MEAVGREPKMAGHILLALTITQRVANVHQDSKGMELTVVRILMNARRSWLASVLSANARTLGVVMIAVATPICCTCMNMTRV